tara:strand:+ start:1267 stop:1914 length:648 start_codon:yes stop_codon:yes gene_type:complete
MLNRVHITALLTFAAAVWLVVLLIQGTEVTTDHMLPFGTAVGSLVAIATGFNHWAWRWKCLHGWFVKKPDIRGTWEIELRSEWINPETGESPPPIKCFYGIKQTFSSLKMHLMTPESQSWLLASAIQESPKTNSYQVFGVYTNQPKVELRGERSEIHYGSFVFDFHGSNNRPDRFDGEYWTDRKTRGSMTGKQITKQTLSTFEDAELASSSDEII